MSARTMREIHDAGHHYLTQAVGPLAADYMVVDPGVVQKIRSVHRAQVVEPFKAKARAYFDRLLEQHRGDGILRGPPEAV